MGHTRGRGFVVSTPEEVAALPEFDQVIVVAQTTQSEEHFEKLVQTIKTRFPGAEIRNTICDATASRQGEIEELARQVEALVVVGGRNSGNTQRLVEISRATGLPTFHVETEQELDLRALSRYRTVGVTAGASTPHWLIGNVVSSLKHAWAFRPGSLTSSLYRVWRFFLKSNLYVALGAGCLSYVSSLLQNVWPDFSYFFVAFFYVYAMHMLNHFTDAASKLNDPVQTMFYGRHRRFLLVSGALSSLASLGLGLYLGWEPFAFILAMSLRGDFLQPEAHSRTFGRGYPYRPPPGNLGLQDRVHRAGLGGAGGPDSGGMLQGRAVGRHRRGLLLCGRPGVHPHRAF